MKIGELAEKTGLSRDTIRFYERNNLISSKPSQSGTNSYRNYPDDLVERLNFISQARDAGMSVADLRDIFQALQGEGCDPENGKQVVQRKIEELEENIVRTRKVVKFLKDTISDG
ncbi:MAG: MerR family transcriptional regulator [Cyanobacteria bacterium P01_E01_bin.42]